MEGLNPKHPFFSKLREEHRLIKQMLSNLEANNYALNALHELFQTNEILHHPKEELILFKKILDHPRLGEGGPLCTLYYDSHLNANPLNLASQLTGKFSDPNDQQKIFYTKSNPLQIPLAEHRAGFEILSFTIENYQSLTFENIKNFLNQYREIQLTHIEKEETCFFHLCSSLLNIEQADQLLHEWDTYSA